MTAATVNRGRRRRVLHLVVGGLLVAVLAADVVVLRPYVSRAAGTLSHPNLYWLGWALVAELASMAALAHAQHRMLRVGGARVSMRRMLVLTYAANAVSVTLPGGTALSSGYTFRRLRMWGASVSLASFTLIASGVLSTVSFGLLGLVGGVLAGVHETDPRFVVAGVLAAGVAALLVRRLARHPGSAARVAERMLGYANRARHRDPAAGRDRVRQFVAELGQIKPRHLDWTAGLAYAGLNWLADLACLVASCRAVGAGGATLELVIVAYVAGMAVSNLSLLPGGLGVVDAAMILALTQGGLSTVSATAAVVLYRLISFVFIVVLGWALWAGTWRLDHRPAPLPSRAQVVGDAGVVIT